MSLGDPYATVDELKVYLTLEETSQFDFALTDALESASREIETYCNRQFNKQTSATARTFEPCNMYGLLEVDDFWTTASLVVKTDATGDGTYETTLTATEYQLYPRNGIVSGVAGWPYWEMAPRAGKSWPLPCTYDARPDTVEVTAQWGWANVPAPVKQACLMLAAKNFRIKDAPLGVAGTSEFGYIRVQDDKGAQGKLKPYKRYLPLVG